MSARPIALLLAAVAALAGTGAFFSSAQLSLAIPLAALGVAAASGLAIVVLASETRFFPPASAPRAEHAPVPLRDAFRTGALGRSTIIATLRSLDHSFGAAHEPMSAEEEERLVAAPREEFLRWVEQQLGRLEGGT
ncbi:MAG: hypothetical protein L3K13_02130 [Thermoplasmata archaeon]|nr:hypothetical protein [Thermoplasmata archaeon]